MNRHKRTGFTIVELLIVIVVIAILAALSIVAFNGAQERARASAASSSASNAKKKLQTYNIENGSFPLTGNLSAAGLTGSEYQYTSDGTTFCLTTTVSTTSYNISDTGTPLAGACVGHTSGGVAPTITNLYKGPNFVSLTYTSGGGSATASNSVITSGGSYSGTSHVRRAVTGSGTVVLYLGTSTGTFSVVSPNTVYTTSCYLRASTTTTIQPVTYYYDSTPAQMSSTTGSATALGTSWTRVSHTVTTPASTAYLQPRFVSGILASGEHLEIDACIVTAGSTIYNFADGATAGWTWSGTANNSTSSGPAL